MSNSWVNIMIAAMFEVMWVIGLKHANNWYEWLGTFIAIIISFYLMIKAGEDIPVGTVYAVFVGLGTTGTIVIDTFVFSEPMTPLKLLFILILLIGVIGLKLVSGKKEGV